MSKRTLPFLAFAFSLVAFASLGPLRDMQQVTIPVANVNVSSPVTLLPSKTVVIRPDEASLVSCITSLDSTCTKEWSAAGLETLGAQGTVKLVNESLIEVIVTSCHSVMHTLGTLAQQTIKDESLSVVLSYGRDSCQYGYQHGVMIGLALLVSGVPDAFLVQAAMPSGISALAIAHIYGLELRIVAGAVALLRAEHPDLSASLLRSLLLDNRQIGTNVGDPGLLDIGAATEQPIYRTDAAGLSRAGGETASGPAR